MDLLGYATGGGFIAATYAAGMAAQLVIDQAVVAGKVDAILDSETILSQTGTYKEVAVAYVVDGVTYGANSEKEGTYGQASAGDGTITGDALRDIYNSPLGMDAVYTPVSDASISLRIMLNKDVVLQPTSLQAQVTEVGTTIEAILADLGKVPVRGETFVADGSVYTVKAISRNDGYEVEVEVVVT